MVALMTQGAACYTVPTVVDYEAAGVKAHYQSNKNQENFKANITLDANGKITGLNIETTAVTPESAIAASSAAILKALQLAEQAMNRAPAPMSMRTPAMQPLTTDNYPENVYIDELLPCGLYLQQCQRERYIPANRQYNCDGYSCASLQ